MKDLAVYEALRLALQTMTQTSEYLHIQLQAVQKDYPHKEDVEQQLILAKRAIVLAEIALADIKAGNNISTELN